jgi:hypothetical protein
LISTPATSIPSEWVFSILNLIYNKLRNRLSKECVDKLQYIYINKRVLQRIKTSYEIDMEADIEDLLIELEDNLVGGGQD